MSSCCHIDFKESAMSPHVTIILDPLSHVAKAWGWGGGMDGGVPMSHVDYKEW